MEFISIICDGNEISVKYNEATKLWGHCVNIYNIMYVNMYLRTYNYVYNYTYVDLAFIMQAACIHLRSYVYTNKYILLA